MAKIEIPRALPDCELIQILAEKASQRHDIDLYFLGRLDAFRERVSGEVRQINQLFPEYTPHDEQYHLKRLFHVACTVLGKDRLEGMNSAELFVLAVGLYGHDWGMAVSEIEKQYIVTGKPPGEISPDDLWILPNERASFTEFARKQQLPVDASGCMEEISVEMWREYVRQTHASRGGERVRRYFESIDGGVADAASRVCEGHWLDFEDLRDADSYPVDFSVLCEPVNLRAIAIYVRLIDLLDLAEDRTPYVIWKFVAPRDPHSKMEWKKHRALRPVTCPSYQEGRVILVDGSTDDHVVYAALEDLRIWCEKQLRGCNDLLARMNDPRHRLDLYHIHWRVAARGFKPVLIQFEFDRERMFEILGDEIYQGDPYVFLRELLQNSIDAIRMRREVLQRKGIAPGDLGVIRVTVEHGDSGDVKVTWQDDGVGMDEYIIRNYFAVAGKSYYRSPDFEREGLELDPISRFGIGTLSCFMVADHIEIETFKDPYLPPPGEPLKIDIPAMLRQFRIELGIRETAEVGTTFRVYVDGNKLPIDGENESMMQLDVTGYLCVLAGFVEFPLVVIEGNRKTIILHPQQDAEAARERFGEAFEVHQLDLSVPWSEVFLPQDLSIAREVLREEHYDLSSDLNMKGYEGSLTYLVPANDDLHFFGRFVAQDHEGSFFIDKIQAGYAKKLLRWSRSWHRSYGAEAIGISRSSTHMPAYTVYRDGILLPTTSSFPASIEVIFGQALPVPRIVANIPKSSAPRVDLARTHVVGQSDHWASPVVQAHLCHRCAASVESLLALDPSERWYQLGRLMVFHNVSSDSLWQTFPHERWPLLVLEPGGYVTCVEWQEMATSALRLLPEVLEKDCATMIHHSWYTDEEKRTLCTQWTGERCLVGSLRHRELKFDFGMRAATDSWETVVEGTHRLTAVRFLCPPWEGDPPLLQEVWLPVEIPEELPDIERVCEKAIEDPTALNAVERALLYEKGSYDLPVFVEFSRPFDQSFAYGWRVLNIKHPISQALLRLAAAAHLSEMRKSLPKDKFGYLNDAILRLHRDYPYYANREITGPVQGSVRGLDELCDDLQNLWSISREAGLLGVIETEDLLPTPDEFVPGTILLDQDSGRPLVVSPDHPTYEEKESIQPFGDSLM